MSPVQVSHKTTNVHMQQYATIYMPILDLYQFGVTQLVNVVQINKYVTQSIFIWSPCSQMKDLNHTFIIFVCSGWIHTWVKSLSYLEQSTPLLKLYNAIYSYTIVYRQAHMFIFYEQLCARVKIHNFMLIFHPEKVQQ